MQGHGGAVGVPGVRMRPLIGHTGRDGLWPAPLVPTRSTSLGPQSLDSSPEGAIITDRACLQMRVYFHY